MEVRLIESVEYWMATTRPNGSPHVVPRWGVWLDGRFWYDGSLETIHAKNLGANSACVLHLEDGQEAVIVEGSSEASEPPGSEFGSRLAREFGRKYAALGYSPDADSWQGADSGGLRVLIPSKVMAWFDFPKDVTRFCF